MLGKIVEYNGKTYKVSAIYPNNGSPWAWLVKNVKKPNDMDHLRLSMTVVDKLTVC